MRSTVPFLIAAFGLAGCGSAPSQPQAAVSDAIVTLPAIAGRPGAAYFRIETQGAPSRLTGLSSDRVGRIELHQSITVDGRSRMAPLTDATATPGTPLGFEPGGRHAMLFDVDPALKVGDRIRITFNFDPAPPVTVDAEVRGPGGAGHGAH